MYVTFPFFRPLSTHALLVIKKVNFDGDISFENDTKNENEDENISSIYGAKTPFSNLSRLARTPGPYAHFHFIL